MVKMGKIKPKMIRQGECDYMRERITDRLGAVRIPAASLERSSIDGLAGMGVTEVIEATGRAVCRCCGQKIAKGALSIRFPYDFTGSGAWTAVEVQIHGEPCKASA